MNEVDRLYWDLIVGSYFTEEELNLVTSINGYSVETLNDCIYARYGYRTFQQMMEEESE